MSPTVASAFPARTQRVEIPGSAIVSKLVTIEELAANVRSTVDKAVHDFAARGFRALCVARADADGGWKLGIRFLQLDLASPDLRR